MKKVGTATLKNNLSAYLRKVKTGMRFIVTDHGEPVASLAPLDGAHAGTLEEKIAALVSEGLAQHESPDRKFAPVKRIDVGDETVSRLVGRLRDPG